MVAAAAHAHDVAKGDRAFVESIAGEAIMPFLYLGAKHMVTGYDHILFLVGVVFYLRRLRDIFIYVSMFTIGHSATLMAGVLLSFGLNAYLVDAVIGLSVVYKGVENIGGFRKIGLAINTKLAVFAFGLCHGMGLATKLLDLAVSKNGLLANLISFNIGVEIGQVLVLFIVISLLSYFRGSSNFLKYGVYVNWFLIVAGLLLTSYQITGFISS